MLATCPNCSHSFHTELHATCPPCYPEKLESSLVMNGEGKERSAAELERTRKILSGGHVVKNNFGKVFKAASASARVWSGVNLELRTYVKSKEHTKLVETNEKFLRLSGWYHENLSWKDAIDMLMPTEEGKFLVRNSADPNFLYTLSVQTKSGPSSIRIFLDNVGRFRLDADHKIAHLMPAFPTVCKLVEFYVEATKKRPMNCQHDGKIWIQGIGHVHSQIRLNEPLYNEPPTLKHLARVAVNKGVLTAAQVVELPNTIVTFLQNYPYKY